MIVYAFSLGPDKRKRRAGFGRRMSAGWCVALTKQASRSSKDPFAMNVYTRHSCCSSQENPTMPTKFWCFSLEQNKTTTMQSKRTCVNQQ